MWLTVGAVTVFLLLLGLRFAIPKHRAQRAISSIEEVGGVVAMRPVRRAWTRNLFNDDILRVLDRVISDPVTMVNLAGRRASAQKLDELMVQMEAVPNLRVLDLNRTAVSEQSLVHLQSMKELRKLSLWDTQITDAGLTHLHTLNQLESLSLRNTRVSDAGLVFLHDLTGLQELNLAGTRTTERGAELLKAKLPRVKIHR